MSKSIKESSINLGDTEEELFRKIVECGKRNEDIILQMIILASNWSYDEIEKAKKAFKERDVDSSSWFSYKMEYYKFFLTIKKMWDESKDNKVINTYDELFN